MRPLMRHRAVNLHRGLSTKRHGVSGPYRIQTPDARLLNMSLLGDLRTPLLTFFHRLVINIPKFSSNVNTIAGLVFCTPASHKHYIKLTWRCVREVSSVWMNYPEAPCVQLGFAISPDPSLRLQCTLSQVYLLSSCQLLTSDSSIIESSTNFNFQD